MPPETASTGIETPASPLEQTCVQSPSQLGEVRCKSVPLQEARALLVDPLILVSQGAALTATRFLAV